MNILLFNQNWFATELRHMGHAVLTCGTSSHLEHPLPSPINHISNILQTLPDGFRPDRIVWLDNSAPVTIMGLEDCDIPILFYSVDTHHHFTLHSYLAPAFDHVLVAQRDYLHHFSNMGTPAGWMPLWAPEYVEISSEKRYGATFVGTLNAALNPERVRFFEALGKLTNIHVTQGHYPSIFPHAEIIVNQTVQGDLNFRVFEAMMCGALLLTERTENGLLDLFQDNIHLATYAPRDARDAAQKIQDLLGNPNLMRTIADAGRREILEKHTMWHRACMVENILASLEKRARSPQRYVGYLMNALQLSRAYEERHRALASDLAIIALGYAESALRAGAVTDTTSTQQIIKACLHQDRLAGNTRGATVIHAYSEAYPSEYLFSLLKVRALLNQGRKEEARQLAATISHEPVEHTFHTAEYAVSLIMQ